MDRRYFTTFGYSKINSTNSRLLCSPVEETASRIGQVFGVKSGTMSQSYDSGGGIDDGETIPTNRKINLNIQNFCLYLQTKKANRYAKIKHDETKTSSN